ncbi:6-phosphofructo-2-kinase/fructose-2,6-bisphosphatase [Platanthera guangdongensis]|uniref:6-phosphofructo-2-kinase/fructose-2, 6-bisphosphatase n=1 Tax=Platanthera guangdongensis TaxID=2320717 RepID=A0ABR2MBX7_9ASPA
MDANIIFQILGTQVFVPLEKYEEYLKAAQRREDMMQQRSIEEHEPYDNSLSLTIEAPSTSWCPASPITLLIDSTLLPDSVESIQRTPLQLPVPAMPAATGAVVAAAVADQMHGPKEDRRLAIVLPDSATGQQLGTAGQQGSDTVAQNEKQGNS